VCSTNGLQGWLLLLAFNAVMVMVYYCYYLAATTRPGYVPAGWMPPPTVQPVLVGVEERVDVAVEERVDVAASTEGDVVAETIRATAAAAAKKLTVRFCKKCSAYKPMRSHHCSQCKRSVRFFFPAGSKAVHCTDASSRWITIARG